MPPLCSFPIATPINSSAIVSSIISSKPNQGIYFHEGPSTYSKVRCIAASIAYCFEYAPRLLLRYSKLLAAQL
uniref:Putative ovule protein n=1 Tax=Solanum chacoense TaxID=4108 RepID=A0A0V0GXZ2_SOLCH